MMRNKIAEEEKHVKIQETMHKHNMMRSIQSSNNYNTEKLWKSGIIENVHFTEMSSNR